MSNWEERGNQRMKEFKKLCYLRLSGTGREWILNLGWLPEKTERGDKATLAAVEVGRKGVIKATLDVSQHDPVLIPI